MAWRNAMLMMSAVGGNAKGGCGLGESKKRNGIRTLLENRLEGREILFFWFIYSIN